MEMLCPRCESWFEAALGFKPLEMMAKFKSSLNPVLRCLHCKHTFSPKWLATEEDDELDR